MSNEPTNFFRQGLDELGLVQGFAKEFEHLPRTAHGFNELEKQELMFLLVNVGAYLESFDDNDAERELMSLFFIDHVSRYPYKCGVYDRPYAVPILKMVVRVFERMSDIPDKFKGDISKLSESLHDNRNLFSNNVFDLNEFTINLMQIESLPVKLKLLDYMYSEGLMIETVVNLSTLDSIDMPTKIKLVEHVCDAVSSRIANLYPSSVHADEFYKYSHWLCVGYNQVAHFKTDIPFKLLALRPLVESYVDLTNQKRFANVFAQLTNIGSEMYGSGFHNLQACAESLGLHKDYTYWRDAKTGIDSTIDIVELPTLS